MKNLFHNIYFFVLFLLFNAVGYAQLYPVQLTPVFNSPYSVKISDYATSMDTKMQLLINPTDITISNRRVRLKLYIQGNGLNIQTSDYAQEQRPIYINGGELQTLTNVDIASLFRLENLQGITPAQYANPLPEGMYNFCFELYDFVTNQKISQKSCANLYLILNDPPILNTPQKNEQIAATEFPNILFTWTPRQINATNVSYKFELKQLLDPTLDPQIGFQMSPTLYEETLFGTAVLYNLSMPILTPGLRYAWRVRAISTTGLSENSIFKNDGYSEIYSFKYTASCAAPTFLLSESQSSKSVKITWEGVPEHTRYQVQYKKQGVRNAQWFSSNSLNRQSLITNLEPGVTYEFRVGSSCDPAEDGIQSFTYSNTSTFTTPTETSSVPAYNCGIVPQINIQNQKPLTNLIQSETFKAGDFPVTILELQGENSPYSGRGYIVVPYLGDTKIAVEFNSIVINTDYQLISGIVETSYNPDWKNITDTEDFAGEGEGGQIEETVPFVIKDIVINPNGDILVNGIDGEQVTIPGGKDTVITDSGVKDEKGNVIVPPKVYNVDSQGNGSNEGVTTAEGGKSTPENTDGVDKNGQATELTAKGVTIAFANNEDASKGAISKYAFDVMPEKASPALKKLYKQASNVALPYKAVLNGDSDTMLATVALTDAKINLDSIVFKTQSGAKIDFKRNDKVFVLTVKGNQSYAEEQVLATIKQGKKWKVIGAFMLVHISPKTVNVALVPTYDISKIKADAIISRTQSIYEKVGVKINFTKENVLKIDSVVPDDVKEIQTEKSTLTSTYSPEQQRINGLYQGSAFSYVLFVTDKASSKKQQGYMRLNGQFGYVFNSADDKTPAHELGHGIFRLEHPFETYNTSESSTNLLMDYGSGAVLNHLDWKQINDPAFKLYAFQSQSSGEFANYVVTPDYRIVSLPTPNSLIYEVCNFDSNKKGLLYGFSEKGIVYCWRENYYYEKEGGARYSGSLKYIENIRKEDKVTLFFDIERPCPSKELHVTYGEIKDKLNTEKLNKFIDDNISRALDVPCNTNTEGDDIKGLIANMKICSGSLSSINFSDENAKKYLSADNRFDLLKCVLHGPVTNKEENLIIRVLKTAPAEQSKSLLNLFTKDQTGILKNIQNGFQLGNYREIYRLLTKIYYEGSDPLVVKNEIEGIKKLYDNKSKNGTVKISYSDLPLIKSVVWLNKGFLERLVEFDLNSIHFLNDEATFNDKGEVSFETEWSNLLLSSGNAKYTNIKPFSILSFKLVSDEPNLSAKKGDILYAPAFMVPFLVNEKFNKEAADAINVAVIIGTAGSGTLAAGGTTSAWATFDIAFSATSLTVDSYRSQIEATEYGKTFLSGWEVFNKAFIGYMALKLSFVTFKVSINTFKNSWHTYKTSEGFVNFKSLNPSAAGRLETEMESLLKKADGIEASTALFSKLDDLSLSTLKKEINSYDEVTKIKFLDEFSEVSDDALKAMNENPSLLSYWKANGDIIKNRVYPNAGNKVWEETKDAILSQGNSVDIKILNEIEEQFKIKPLSNNKPVMAAAYCEELGGEVVVKYNLSPSEKSSFNYKNLDPIIGDHIDYLNFIREDALNGGKLYEKLYKGVKFEKITTAGDAASHAEVLAMDEVIKLMRKKGLLNSSADLHKIKILIKGKAEWGNMCRCPHCFQLSSGTKIIGNQ